MSRKQIGAFAYTDISIIGIILVSFVMLVLFLLLPRSTSPGAKDADGSTTVWTSDVGKSMVYRVTDTDAGVVCWIYSSYGKGGIDCLPLSETYLKNESGAPHE